jgi:hypothetical protein
VEEILIGRLRWSVAPKTSSLPSEDFINDMLVVGNADVVEAVVDDRD